MKILYLDFLCPVGHLNLDINQIKRLSNIGDVYVISQKGRYTELPSNVRNIEKKSIEIKQGKFSNRMSSLKTMLISAIESRRIDHDYIIVSSFETIMFALGRYLFNKKDRIILFHHFNTDELSSRVKAFFFRTYMNKVTHIVFSEFIRDHLINKFGVNPRHVFVLPHHMNKISITKGNAKEYQCVGLSSSNDENIIESIIRKEEKENLLKQMKIKVVLKSKEFEYDNGYLKVVKGYLEKEVYSDFIDNAQSIYMPFPNRFQFRMSGTLIDALTNNKIVYGSDIPVMRQYSIKYPSICKVVNDENAFIETLLSNNDNNKKLEDEFDKFKEDHSEERIELILAKILNDSES